MVAERMRRCKRAGNQGRGQPAHLKKAEDVQGKRWNEREARRREKGEPAPYFHLREERGYGTLLGLQAEAIELTPLCIEP